tara:strand:- start:4960 stop:5376 length:417 start_codon:yes stop_codon:yes gene_type:complete
MQKNSRVTRVTGNGTWEGKFGLMYKFEIEMENGDVGENLSKTDECRFKEGQQTDYEFIDGQFPKIKPINTFAPSGGGGFKKNEQVQEYIIKQSSLKCATDFCIAKGTTNTEDVLAVAEIFTDWVLEGKKALPFEKAPF